MPLDDQMIDQTFQQFIKSGSGTDEIKQLYESMPYLDNDQQRVLTLLSSLAVKYESPVLQDIYTRIHEYAKNNRKLGFRYTRLIEALSLYKHFRGYKASHNSNENKDSM